MVKAFYITSGLFETMEGALQRSQNTINNWAASNKVKITSTSQSANAGDIMILVTYEPR